MLQNGTSVEDWSGHPFQEQDECNQKGKVDDD